VSKFRSRNSATEIPRRRRDVELRQHPARPSVFSIVPWLVSHG
jgi:hypothetical protein